MCFLSGWMALLGDRKCVRLIALGVKAELSCHGHAWQRWTSNTPQLFNFLLCRIGGMLTDAAVIVARAYQQLACISTLEEASLFKG
jgi:hypothetical protein|mmetsp:Transcript_1680/g.2827  ORF Transcript_1680/g.2827 Transcript_1680/m.2827 type:complete len:86 (+) Transcript_1680:1202-1459(+)